MPRVVPVMRYVVGVVVVVEDILARRKSCLGLDVVVVDVDGTVLDPIVVVLMPAYLIEKRGGWGVVSFVPLSFFASPRGLVVDDACLVLSLTWKSTPRVRSSLHIPEADSRRATLL